MEADTPILHLENIILLFYFFTSVQIFKLPRNATGYYLHEVHVMSLVLTVQIRPDIKTQVTNVVTNMHRHGVYIIKLTGMQCGKDVHGVGGKVLRTVIRFYKGSKVCGNWQ